MSEVLVEFDTILNAPDGTRWLPRACGGVADDGLWEGWIEFLSMEESAAPVQTGRETEQPNRDDLMYWAQGLTSIYLEGALQRARNPQPVSVDRGSTARPNFNGPARHAPAGSIGRVMPRPVLNPYEVYQQGQNILVQGLSALNPGRLRDIVVAYGFADAESVDRAGREKLTSLILAGVRRPLGVQHSEEPAQRSD